MAIHKTRSSQAAKHDCTHAYLAIIPAPLTRAALGREPKPVRGCSDGPVRSDQQAEANLTIREGPAVADAPGMLERLALDRHQRRHDCRLQDARHGVAMHYKGSKKGVLIVRS